MEADLAELKQQVAVLQKELSRVAGMIMVHPRARYPPCILTRLL